MLNLDLTQRVGGREQGDGVSLMGGQHFKRKKQKGYFRSKKKSISGGGQLVFEEYPDQSTQHDFQSVSSTRDQTALGKRTAQRGNHSSLIGKSRVHGYSIRPARKSEPPSVINRTTNYLVTMGIQEKYIFKKEESFLKEETEDIRQHKSLLLRKKNEKIGTIP